MKCYGLTRTISIHSAMLGFAAALLASAASPVQSAEPSVSAMTASEQLRLGERMYREGLLPSGEPMQAYVKGDIPAPGTAFSCVSCHMKSGLGSVEGGVFTPPTNGKTLFQPRDMPGAGNNRRNAGMTMTSGKDRTLPAIQPLPARPAYSETTLADVLRGGRDPSGRTLNMLMPRYRLADSDMSILISYLEQLSSDYSPGVSREFIHFATIIVEGVPKDQVAAMMEPLESFVRSANKQQVDLEAQRARLREKYMEPTYRRVRLSSWLLKGTPDTWQGQLEEYYRKEPVFALVAGISPGEWGPIHKFTEENGIPCILPNTDFPVVSADNRYTLFFSKGFAQEGEMAARYLISQDMPLASGKIVQVVDNSRQGQILAEAFSQTITGQGLPAPLTARHDSSAAITEEYLQTILEKEKPDILAIWADAAALHLVDKASTDGRTIPVIMASSSLLGKDLWSIPSRIRANTYITYPFRLPQDEARFERLLKPADNKGRMSDEARIVQGRTYSSLRVLTQALREMKGEFYRENLMDVIGMQQDIQLPLYERLSFGPDQRYASKGCYIVQLSPGDKPELMKKSDWVIH